MAARREGQHVDEVVEPDTAAATRRRRGVVTVVALVSVLVVAGAGAFAWWSWMPDHRPARAAGETYGVDVSAHQGVIDWDRVAADDVSFAYLKATEGGDHVDARFAANWTGAASAGLARGAYHFFTFCRTGAEQAANFLSVVPGGDDALPAAIDLEFGGNCSRRPDQEWMDREVGVFIDLVEAATGRPVIIYALDDFTAQYGSRTAWDRPLWYRRILRAPPTDDWWIWQFTFRARVDGIEGGVDLNVMKADGP